MRSPPDEGPYTTFDNNSILALEEFRNLGIDFVSYQENIDTSSPLGELLSKVVDGAIRRRSHPPGLR